MEVAEYAATPDVDAYDDADKDTTTTAEMAHPRKVSA